MSGFFFELRNELPVSPFDLIEYHFESLPDGTVLLIKREEQDNVG